MAKVLTLQDLINRKYSEIAPESVKDLYDLVIPPGVPQSIIYDLIEMFDLEVNERIFQSQNPDLGEMKTIVLRGELETVIEAEAFFKKEMKSLIEE
ncbi:MAG: hypothetical protein GX362_06375 [Methanosarcinaceae archaeon]|nr:hypothetical protein [Methanosarcinaceae archaeon]